MPEAVEFALGLTLIGGLGLAQFFLMIRLVEHITKPPQ